MSENSSETVREFDPPNPDQTVPLEQLLRCRLGHRVNDLRVWFEPHGLVITGYTRSYYDKQMAQHVVREIFGRDVADNRIAVDSASGENHLARGHHCGHGLVSKHRPHLRHFPK
jgi:hypothetical protein